MKLSPKDRAHIREIVSLVKYGAKLLGKDGRRVLEQEVSKALKSK